MPGMPLRPSLLVASLAVALAAAGASAAPTEIRLLPAGRFRAADGSGRPAGVPDGWLLDDAGAARLVAAATERASAYVIDYEHQTLNAAANGQPAPAAGWYKRLEWRPGDGLYAVDVSWTVRAAALIAAGEYRYVSPVFSYAADGRVLALGPAALTNNPGLDGLADLAALSALFPPQEVTMKELLKALGLPETATEAEALAALVALKSAHQGELAALTARAPDPAKYVEVATLTALRGELATASAELAALKAKESAAEVDRTVTAALAAGKLTPATEKWARDLGAKDLAALTAYIEAAPVVVKPGETQTGGEKPGGRPDASSAPAIAEAAMKYQAEQAASGVSVTSAAAVAHVTKGA